MRAASEQGTLEKRLDAGGWGLFFVWVGIALAANLGWGAGLVGVGIITLGVQVARKLLGLEPDRFSVAVGALFVVGGIWKAINATVELVPILSIAAGIALLASALGRPRRARRRVGPPGAPAAHRSA